MEKDAHTIYSSIEPKDSLHSSSYHFLHCLQSKCYVRIFQSRLILVYLLFFFQHFNLLICPRAVQSLLDKLSSLTEGERKKHATFLGSCNVQTKKSRDLQELVSLSQQHELISQVQKEIELRVSKVTFCPLPYLSIQKQLLQQISLNTTRREAMECFLCWSRFPFVSPQYVAYARKHGA